LTDFEKKIKDTCKDSLTKKRRIVLGPYKDADANLKTIIDKLDNAFQAGG